MSLTECRWIVVVPIWAQMYFYTLLIIMGALPDLIEFNSGLFTVTHHIQYET